MFKIMANIDLVIKIDEEDYKIMKHNIAVNNPLCPLSQKAMVSKVANGVPLPKGHGNLIQREDAETIFRNARIALYKQSRTEQIKDLQTRESMLLNAEQFVHLIKPIIEADKEK